MSLRRLLAVALDEVEDDIATTAAGDAILLERCDLRKESGGVVGELQSKGEYGFQGRGEESSPGRRRGGFVLAKGRESVGGLFRATSRATHLGFREKWKLAEREVVCHGTIEGEFKGLATRRR
jgi:hypothetical protein